MDVVLSEWVTPVVLYVLLAFGLVRWMGKKYIVGTKRIWRLFVQFLTCFVVLLALAIWQGQVELAFSNLTVVWAMGIGSGLACFYNWKAQDLSLGKTSVFTIWDDILGMCLSYVVLSEGRYLNTVSATGIVLSGIALVLFAVHAFRRRGDTNVLPLAFFGYIAIYSVIWGVGLFGQRYFKVDEVPFAAFGLAWYGGTVITSLGLLLFMHEKDPKQRGMLTLRETVITIVYGLLIALCLGVAFWSYQSPQTIVQPIYFVSEAIIPTIIAFLFFNERVQYGKIEYLYLGLAVGAVALIFVGYMELFV